VPPALASTFHDDHAWLRAWISGTVPTLDSVRSYGERLRAHVRFEERVLFPRLQSLTATDMVK